MRQLIGATKSGEKAPGVDNDLINSTYATVTRIGQQPRPWVVVNMIQSLDGGISINGVSGPLGGPADKSVFRALRGCAPLILVGAQTVRSEVYRPAACPIAVVTTTGDFGPATELRDDPRTILVSPGGETINLAKALEALATLGFPWILCEGGPSLNGQLFELDLVDEVCVTVSPLAVAGRASRMAHGRGSVAHRFSLHSAIEHDSMLLLRYLRLRNPL